MENEPGSSMHVHQSIVDRETGKNIFSDGNGKDSALLFAYIAGFQKYLPAAMAFFAPYVNSYRRITRHQSAPINVQWGYDNRTVGFRVPLSAADARRVENRVAGADVNPYLAIAVSLACGYLGIKEQLKPTEPLEGNAYEFPYGLPRNLDGALNNLKECEPLREILGDKFVSAYFAVKEEEYETFFRVIGSWEREYLLLNV
jgi:glutamine synthetase